MGGLGAVLAITPPQLGSTSAITIAGGLATGSGATSTASASSSSTSVATTKAATATKSAMPTKSSGRNEVATAPAATATATADATAATTAPATASKSSINGTFTGPSVFVKYGNVQVKITVVSGRITDAVAVVAPSGKNDRYTNMAVPILKAQTLKAQSANIQGASGASYTSYGWYTSVQRALAEAGL